MTEEWQPILDFWFGPLDASGFPATPRGKLWWQGGEALDADIRQRFGARVEQALSGEPREWAEQPRGRLALILLLDQFTRNVFRRRARAFAGDAQAQDLCLTGLAAGADAALAPIERIFFCMPLVHSESVTLQKQVDTYLANLADSLPHSQRAQVGGFRDSARQHRAIIEQFGRFPHRNAVLERPSTAAEIAWLAASGRRFGQ